MKKTFVIFLLFFYSAGSFLLPAGNFAYIEQLPQLYGDFCASNNSNDVFEFIEEQFLEWEFLEEDPYVKHGNETNPVPFHAVSVPLIVALPTHENTVLNIRPKEKPISYFTQYTLKDYWVYPASVFHPPKV